jgi:hypothetical protein
MANPWIQFVKDFAKKNGMKYPVAVGDPACKAAYNSRKGNNQTAQKKVGSKKKRRFRTTIRRI